MPDLAVELSGVSKDYHGLRPLRIASLALASGERAAIVGLDGPMAEVFINLVTGATLPDAGDVRIFGQSTATITDSADWLTLVDRFGIVSARAVLLEELSVMQNLAMPFTLEIDPPPDDVQAQAGALAREVGFLDTDLQRPVAALDELGKVRVRLGRALALSPAVLLLEHASAGLLRPEMLRLGATVREIAVRRRMAVVAASADGDFAAAVAARVFTHEPATGRLVERRNGLLSRLFGH